MPSHIVFLLSCCIRTIAMRKISSLQHKPRNNSMEHTAFIMKPFAFCPHALFSLKKKDQSTHHHRTVQRHLKFSAVLGTTLEKSSNVTRSGLSPPIRSWLRLGKTGLTNLDVEEHHGILAHLALPHQLISMHNSSVASPHGSQTIGPIGAWRRGGRWFVAP